MKRWAMCVARRSSSPTSFYRQLAVSREALLPLLLLRDLTDQFHDSPLSINRFFTPSSIGASVS